MLVEPLQRGADPELDAPHRVGLVADRRLLAPAQVVVRRRAGARRAAPPWRRSTSRRRPCRRRGSRRCRRPTSGGSPARRTGRPRRSISWRRRSLPRCVSFCRIVVHATSALTGRSRMASSGIVSESLQHRLRVARTRRAMHPRNVDPFGCSMAVRQSDSAASCTARLRPGCSSPACCGRDGAVRNVRGQLDAPHRSSSRSVAAARSSACAAHAAARRGGRRAGRSRRRRGTRLDVRDTSPSGANPWLYWVVKGVLTPVLRGLLPGPGRGSRAPPGAGAGHPRREPPVVPRLDLPAARDPAPGHVRRQGRVLRRPEDGVVLPRRRPDPDPARGRQRERAGARVGDRGARGAAGCSASTPRARAPATATCTAATPASPASRSRTGAPIVPGRA